MKPFALFLAVSCLSGGLMAADAQNTSPQDPIRLMMDAARFRGAEDSLVTVEIHYAINQTGLTYRADSSGWTGTADLTLLLRSKDSIVHAERWLVPHTNRDTSGMDPSAMLLGVNSLQLTPGEYVLVMIARDRNALGRVDSVAFRLPVARSVTNRVALSDIEFASSIRQGSKQSPFYKNTLEVLPNVGALYGEDQKCFYYLEAYNLLVGEDRSDLTMRSVVLDAVGKELLSRERIRKRAGESAVLVDQFPTEKFRTGTYTLLVALLDTTRRPLAQSSRRFYVYNPALGVDSTLLAGGRSLPLPVYSSMEEPELDRDFRYSKYETTDAERSQYAELKGVEVKRKFLSDIWRRRPQGAREVYMSRVEHANTDFSQMSREGYRTDRGRVYITYGPPDDVERHPNEPDMKPYEVWAYNNIQGGVIFVFLQRNQGGDYELVHSTHRNELHDENWEMYARTN